MVSVIIPCHNCAGFIHRAINSVFQQDYIVAEIILVNNNSTDETLNVIRDLQARHPDLITVYNETKKGAPAARNHGLYKAKGEWIQFLDADDELLPQKISRQIHLANKTNADVVAGECRLKYTLPKSSFEVIRHNKKDVWKGLITSNLGITSSNLWRRSSLLKVSGWDEELSSSQEYDLMFRMLKSNCHVVADNLQNTIVHFSGDSVSKSTSSSKLKTILNNRIALRLKIRNELRYRNMLTDDLARAVDAYIYTEIMRSNHMFPDYANSLLQQYHLRVGLMTVMRLKLKRFLQSINQPLLKST
ncbi:glycosyltransferase family 2 protein [Inquilinus sp. KBS0705]|nr:glycosyltransferase family 2 protein [Inquilinus sp. KBS0705]